MAEQHVYDFFISYTKADEPWAEWIAWQLEAAQPPYSTFLQAWDFHAGDDWVRLMQEGTTKARRTIAVLSPDLLEAKYTKAEWQAAFAQDPTGERGLLVPVRVAKCKPDGLLKARIYIDLVGLEKVQARDRLLGSVKKERRKPAREPDFPTTSVTSSEPFFPGASPQQLTLPRPRRKDDPDSPPSPVPTNPFPRVNDTNKTSTMVRRRVGYVGGAPCCLQSSRLP